MEKGVALSRGSKEEGGRWEGKVSGHAAVYRQIYGITGVVHLEDEIGVDLPPHAGIEGPYDLVYLAL